MAGPNIFLLGATGYIGGTILDALVKGHPEYNITVLLRRVPIDFAATYPNVSIVRGDFDSTDTISERASRSDIVIHTGSSAHEPSIRALIAGFLRRTSSSTPAFLIHLSGTLDVSDWLINPNPGTASSKIWSDVNDIEALTAVSAASIRKTNSVIVRAASDNPEKLKTAIVCPPSIYGPGRGLGRKQTVFFREYLRAAKEVGGAFCAGEGTNVMGWCHVEDVVRVYVKLVEAAVRGGEGGDWGGEGYYFTETQSTPFFALSKILGDMLTQKGLLRSGSEDPIRLPAERVDTLVPAPANLPLGRYMFASNSRSRPDRAAKLFGYDGKEKSVFEAMEEEVIGLVNPGQWERLDKKRKEW